MTYLSHSAIFAFVNPESIRTSIDVPRDLHRRLHEVAARKGCSARQLILRSIERAVEDRFMRIEHAQIVRRSSDPAQLIAQLEDFRPVLVEKWLDRSVSIASRSY